MFELFGYRNGYFVFVAIFLLLLSCVQSHEANKEINRINEENITNLNKKQLQTAPFVPLIISIFFLVLSLVLPLLPLNH